MATPSAQTVLTKQLTSSGLTSSQASTLAKDLLNAAWDAGMSKTVESVNEIINNSAYWTSGGVIEAAVNKYVAQNTGDVKAARGQSSVDAWNAKASSISTVLNTALNTLSDRDVNISIDLSDKTNAAGTKFDKSVVTKSGHQTQVAGTVSLSMTPTTKTVDIPVYQDVTTIDNITTYVPVEKTGTKTVTDVSYKDVTTTTYSEERSSNISSSMIPYMRSIPVLVSAKGMKPNTTFKAYFDTINVDTNITPATILSTVPVTGYTYVFDEKINVGYDNISRKIGNSPILTLTSGEVVVGQTSGASGVVVGSELNNSTINRNLHIIVIEGTFQQNEIIVGLASASRATITNITTPTTITTSQYGNFFGIFTIPNSTDKRILTGDKQFLLTSSTINSTDADSFSRVNFISSGTLRTEQQIVTNVAHTSTSSVRVETPRQESYVYSVDEAVTTQVSKTETVQVGTTQQIVTNNDGITTVAPTKVVSHAVSEPLAQTFYVAEPSGICLTGIDLYFASKDTTLPVKLSIINVEPGGQPGMKEIPMSQVTMAAENVNVSSTTIVSDIDGRTYAVPDKATKFTFDAPIYLNGNTSYAIFISSDSFNYNVWTSYVGDSTVNGMGLVAKQPQLGTLFKSQNAVTWSTDQLQDLCFKMYRAKFNTNSNVNVYFGNVPPNAKKLQNSISVTAGSKKLRVFLMNHGLQNGHLFTISGATENQFGIPYTELNGTFTVSNADFDTFVITLPTTTPTSTGIIDQLNLYGTRNIRFDQLKLMINDLVLPNTKLSYVYTGFKAGATSWQDAFYPINNYKQTDMPEPLTVLNTETVLTLGSNYSLALGATLFTDNEYVSPFIDVHRIAAVAVGNKINVPDSSLNVSEIDFVNIAQNWASNTYVNINSTIYSGSNKYVVTTSGKFGSSAPTHTSGSASNGTATLLYIGTSALITVDDTNNKLLTSNSYVQTLFKNVAIGSVITLSGCNTSANNGDAVVTAVATDGTYITVSKDLLSETSTSIVVSNGIRFRNELTPAGSSSVADYVTKKMKFANQSTAFRLMFTYNMPSVAGIDIYYKLSNSFDSSDHSALPYTLLVPDTTLLTSENKSVMYNASLQQTGLTPFDTLSIKIVYTSTNTSKFPRMKNFRVIALA